MTVNQFKTLKVGDFVSPNRGKDKDNLCIVIHTIADYKSHKCVAGFIYADYVDKSLSTKREKHKHADFFGSYKGFKRIYNVSYSRDKHLL